MPLQLRTVSEAVAALGAVEALLCLLVSVFDVLLQGAVTLVAASAVRAGEQLGEGVRSSWMWGENRRDCNDMCEKEVGRTGKGYRHMVNRQGSLMFHMGCCSNTPVRFHQSLKVPPSQVNSPQVTKRIEAGF